MKIALLGYGKMGQIIERFALERGHEIVLKITIDNQEDLTESNLRKADVAIDFSAPDAALGNIYACFDANLPVVVGTTGWYGELQEVKNECLVSNNTLLYGSNFSIGVNLFFHMNKLLAKLMNDYPAYEVLGRGDPPHPEAGFPERHGDDHCRRYYCQFRPEK